MKIISISPIVCFVNFNNSIGRSTSMTKNRNKKMQIFQFKRSKRGNKKIMKIEMDINALIMMSNSKITASIVMKKIKMKITLIIRRQLKSHLITITLILGNLIHCKIKKIPKILNQSRQLLVLNQLLKSLRLKKTKINI